MVIVVLLVLVALLAAWYFLAGPARVGRLRFDSPGIAAFIIEGGSRPDQVDMSWMML